MNVQDLPKSMKAVRMAEVESAFDMKLRLTLGIICVSPFLIIAAVSIGTLL